MDAYVFPRTATTDAVTALARAVAEERGIRVVCPLEGDRELYVAVTAPDRPSLEGLVREVTETAGVADAAVFFAPEEPDPERAAFPTYIPVAQGVAFTVLDVAEPNVTQVVAAVRAAPGVVGVTAVDDGTRVLAETTAKSFAAARAAAESLDELAAVRTVFVSAGSADQAAGLRTA